MIDDEKEQLKLELLGAIKAVFDGVAAPVDCSPWFRLDAGFEGAPANPNPLTIDIYGDGDFDEPFYSVVVADVLERMFDIRSDKTGKLIPEETDFESFRLMRDELHRLADLIDKALATRQD
jgi:hypothetical protein